MWFRNIFRPLNRKNDRRAARRRPGDTALFDENFLRRLDRLNLQAVRYLQGNPLSGEHFSRQYLPTSVFSDHRPYTSGDDLRYVDWNAYARHDQMVLKVGEAEQNVNVHLLIDVSRSMAWGQPPKLRTLQQLAAALGYLSLAHGDRLLISPFGLEHLRPFGPTQGKARLIEMLRYLEDMPLQRQTDLQQVLVNHARRYQRGGMLVLCSDLLTSGGLAEGLRLFMPPRWQVVVLHMLDPRELRPELQGSMELEDHETGQRMSVALDSETLAAYRHTVTTWQEKIARTCGRYGANYSQVMSDWPLEQKIIPYLRARRLLV
jgi:uncharacterized protein (DUF58 family)